MLYNVYCDETCHLEHDGINDMVIGAVWCPQNKLREINQRIKEIKARNGISPSTELKWTKVSPAKVQAYKDIIDYFFDDDDLHFRAIIIPDKSKLNHAAFHQTHDEWYYKMYFDMLKVILSPKDRYEIYIDIKDTNSYRKAQKLKEVCSNSMYDFSQSVIQRLQPVRSDEIQIMQLVDLLIGAVGYQNRVFPNGTTRSQAKIDIIELIKKRSNYLLTRTTLLRESMVGCNNPKIRPDYAHIELMKKLIANDIVVIASGCSAQAAAKAGLMDKSAKDICGAGLKRVCELADIPPVLHMGSCVDISRMMILAAELAKDSGLQINQLPVVGCAPEWMSEKAVSIGNYVVGTGIDTFLGVDPYVSGSSEMCELLTEGTRKWTGAAYTVETDIEKLTDLMIERIEEKRTALGI